MGDIMVENMMLISEVIESILESMPQLCIQYIYN